MSIPREERIRTRTLFIENLKRGERTEINGVTVYKRPAGEWMLGVSISRKAGKAVQRNRFKRQLREIYRSAKRICPNNYHILFIIKKKIDKIDFYDFQQKFINWILQ